MRELIDMFIPLVNISAEAAAANGNDLVSLALAVFLKSFQGWLDASYRPWALASGLLHLTPVFSSLSCLLSFPSLDFSMADTVRELFEALSSVPQLESILAERALPTLVRVSSCLQYLFPCWFRAQDVLPSPFIVLLPCPQGLDSCAPQR